MTWAELHRRLDAYYAARRQWTVLPYHEWRRLNDRRQTVSLTQGERRSA